MFKPKPPTLVMLKAYLNLAHRLNGVAVGVFILLALFGTTVAALSTLLNPAPATAATQSTINFQARLQANTGALVPDGKYNIQFKLYDAASAGTNLWTESYIDVDGSAGTTADDFRVTVKNGYLSVPLGSRTSFPGTINWDQQLWLTMNIGGVNVTATPTYDGEMSPRLALTAVPYAFRAGQLATTNGSYTSTLAINAPTGGSQTFQIADQGAAGTYTLLTNTSGVQLQTATPGTQQTGNLNISGTGILGTKLQTPIVDTISAGTLTLGGTNATAISLADNTTLAAGVNLSFASGAGNFDQSLSTGTFATGSGAVSLNGNVTVASGKSFSAPQLTSTATTGTAPLVVASTTKVTNLNADLLDGLDSTAFATATGSTAYIQNTSSPQASSNFNISGNGTIGTNLTVSGSASITSGLNNNNGGITNIGAITGATTINGSGNVTIQAAGTNTLLMDTVGAGTVGLGMVNAGTVTIGNASSAVSILSNGTLNLGNNAVNKTINIGATGSTANTTAVNIATSTGAAQTVVVGSTQGSSTVTLQAGNTVQSLGTAGATIQTTTNSATAFQVQNATGAPIFLVDTTNNVNLLSYSGFEVASANVPVGWTANAGATLTQNTNKANTYFGLYSAQVVTGATGRGLNTSSFTQTVASGTYVVSFYAKLSSGTMAANLFTITSTDGTTHTCTGSSAITINATGFQRVTCSVTTTGNMTNLSITQSDATSRTIYIDSVQLQSGSTATPYQIGTIQLRGVITNPATFTNLADSTTAFQITNAAGTNLFTADTLNGQIGIGTGAPSRTLDVAVNNSQIAAPMALFEQAGSGDASLEFRNSGNSFYLGQDTSNSNSFTINSNTAAAPATGGSPGTIAHVQSANSGANSGGTNGSTISATFGSAVTSGNLIVAGGSWDSGNNQTLASCSDTLGNTYAIANQKADTTNGQSGGVCYALNTHATGSTTVTMTFSAPTAFRSTVISEYSGASGVTDGTNAATGTASSGVANSMSGGLVTTTQNNDLIYGYVGNNSSNGSTVTAGTSFTLHNYIASAGANEERIVATSGTAAAATFTSNSNERYNAITVAFKATVTGQTPGTVTDTYNNPLFKLSQTGALTLQNSTDSSGAFTVNNAAGLNLLKVDASSADVIVGSATTDSTGVLLVLDSYNQASDPTGVNGAMYYNTNMNRFRCYEGSSWKNCVGVLNAVTLLGSQTSNMTTSTTTEGQVLGVTLPANSVAVGDTFRFTSYFIRTGTTSGNMGIRIRVGPTSLGSSTATSVTTVTSTTSATSGMVSGQITIRSIGSSGTVLGGIYTMYGVSAGTATASVNTTSATSAQNTTVSNVLELTAQSSVTGNTYTFYNTAIEKLSNQ